MKLQGNTDRILEYIVSNPGCHLRQLKKDLGLSMGTVQYHLNHLEKAGKIISDKFNLHRCYYVSGLFKENERCILRILNQQTARQLLMFIVERKSPTQTDIVNHLGITAASVNWHVKRLVELGIISESREGKYRRYQLVVEPRHIIVILKNYRTNLWNTWSDRLAEMFLSLSRPET
ncbi:MAG: winged helix-turn-helix transcriptional regulator [Thaumarchaeota archaeon]|nr:winged helix-turn-helix transcriptional regulator [Nitrososphaerota archaeon]